MLLFDSVHTYKYSAMCRSPIHYAAYGGHLDAVCLLLDYGAYLVEHEILLRTACIQGRVDMVKELINRGINKISHASHCYNVWTSIKRDDIPMIKILIDTFGDISADGLSFYTDEERSYITRIADTILIACRENYIELIRELINAGMKLLYCRCKFINTALRYGNYEIANMITMINPMAKTIDSIGNN